MMDEVLKKSIPPRHDFAARERVKRAKNRAARSQPLALVSRSLQSICSPRGKTPQMPFFTTAPKTFDPWKIRGTILCIGTAGGRSRTARPPPCRASPRPSPARYTRFERHRQQREGAETLNPQNTTTQSRRAVICVEMFPRFPVSRVRGHTHPPLGDFFFRS